MYAYFYLCVYMYAFTNAHMYICIHAHINIYILYLFLFAHTYLQRRTDRSLPDAVAGITKAFTPPPSCPQAVLAVQRRRAVAVGRVLHLRPGRLRRVQRLRPPDRRQDPEGRPDHPVPGGGQAQSPDGPDGALRGRGVRRRPQVRGPRAACWAWARGADAEAVGLRVLLLGGRDGGRGCT